MHQPQFIFKLFSKAKISIVAACLFMQACTYLGIGSLDTDYLMNKYTDETSSFVMAEGIPVHYKVQGQGEPIILIHGFMSSLQTWDRWTEVLSQNYTVYRMDLPGFGLSGNLSSDHEYSLDDYMRMMDIFFEHNNIQSAHIVGNSLGGIVSWKYAVKEPQRIKTVALIDSVGHPLNLPWPIDLVSNPITSPGARIFAPKFLFSAALKQVYGDNNRLKPETIDSYHEMAMRKGNKRNLVIISKAIQREVKDPNLGADFKNLQMPALLMWGQDDKWIPIENAYQLKKDLPSSTLLIYPGVGHLPMEEIPDRSVSDYMNFLSDTRR